jgi:hypothetical protein
MVGVLALEVKPSNVVGSMRRESRSFIRAEPSERAIEEDQLRKG